MSAAVITASASITVAVLAFLLNQHAESRRERRQTELTRINAQLRELYGPLNALVDINERIWEAMRSASLPARPERRAGGGTPEWRRWRDLALMPTNRHMRNLIIEHADLLIEDHIPQPLRNFCAHVASLEVVLASQQEGVHEPTLIRHPGAEYTDYVSGSFAHLKRRQRDLAKQTARWPHHGPGSTTAMASEQL